MATDAAVRPCVRVMGVVYTCALRGHHLAGSWRAGERVALLAFREATIVNFLIRTLLLRPPVTVCVIAHADEGRRAARAPPGPYLPTGHRRGRDMNQDTRRYRTGTSPLWQFARVAFTATPAARPTTPVTRALS